MKYGIDEHLEDLTEGLLVEWRRNLPPEKRTAEKRRTLLATQIEYRRTREVYNKNGFPEASLYSGSFSRAYNPNSRKRGWGKTREDR